MSYEMNTKGCTKLCVYAREFVSKRLNLTFRMPAVNFTVKSSGEWLVMECLKGKWGRRLLNSISARLVIACGVTVNEWLSALSWVGFSTGRTLVDLNVQKNRQMEREIFWHEATESRVEVKTDRASKGRRSQAHRGRPIQWIRTKTTDYSASFICESPSVKKGSLWHRLL